MSENNETNERKTMLTITAARNQGLVEHLIFSAPGEMLDTQYGGMRYDRYLSFEAERITRGGDRRAAIVENQGQVALFVDDVSNLN